MSVQRSVSRLFNSLQRPLDYPIHLLSGVASFDPASISGLRSRLLDANTFTSPIDSKYYLKDSSTTNTHLPRQGRCWLFDGTNDVATSTSGSLKLVGTDASFAICGWIKAANPASAGGVAATWNGSLGFSCYYRNDLLRVYKNGETKSFATTLVGGTWYHLAYVLNGVSVTAFINGVSIGASQSFADATISSGGSFFVGQSTSAATAPASSVRDVRIYNVAKTAGEISAIYNQSRTGSGTFDTAGLVGAYPCNEESGTTGYDISGNGNHLTLTNITQATFHAADTGVLANRNNAEGYRLSGSVYIPKRLSDSLAADGNALTVTGRAAYHGCAETPCVTNHTGTVYIAAAHLTGSETVVSFSGSTTTPTISAGRIDWQSGQTLSDLTLSDGTRYTMQEGPGSGNTNRTVYNVNGSTNHGTLTNGTVATIWGSRLAGTAQDWCILYGGRIGAAGEFVPGRVSGSLAADGSAKTLAAGKFGNPFSRLNLNPATAAELNGRSVPTSAAAGADINATITPTDSAFRRTASDGDDRILIYDATLSGADLSNVEGYLV